MSCSPPIQHGHTHNISTLRLLLILLSALLVSCSSQRILEDNEYLLSAVKIESSDKHIASGSVQGTLTQKPNSKWFGIAKVPLGMYSLAGKKDSNFVCRLLRKTGEPPVIYNESATNNTAKALQNHLVSKGFRNGWVSFDTVRTKHKVKLTYQLHCGPRSYIRNITTNIQSKRIEHILLRERHASVLHGGMPLEINKLYEERSRIVNLLQDNGFYQINKEFITFTIDTIQGDLGTSVTINCIAPAGVDTTIAYTPYKIKDISVFEDCNNNDTSILTQYRGLNFQHLKTRTNVSKRVYRSMIGLNTDSIYRASDVNYTNNALNSLSALSFSTIRTIEKHPFINYEIYVRKAKPHNISFEIEGTNTAGDLGAAAALTYTNRNLFKGSELFRIKIRGAYEAITGLEGYANQNYMEYSTEANLSFPALFMPFSEQFRYQLKATTEFGLIYNMQERPEFHRRMLTANVSYKWRRNTDNRIQHKFDLLSLNYIFMPWISDTFRKNYLEGDDPRYGILRYSYENLFIMNMGYSFVMKSNKNFNNNALSQTNTWQLRFNIESAGNLLNLTKSLFNAKHNHNGYYELFGIAFSQYAKADIDFVKSYPINENSSLAFHAALGVAIPYGNSTIIPYEKRYFAGGANSVRGWSVRELGPGSYKGTDGKIDFINQTGNVKLDLSLEYRTYLFWKFYGAAFIDAGNIWNTRNNAQSGEQLKSDKFLKEIAVAYGLGLRLNFDYFILRFDGGMKAINPSIPTGKGHYPIINPKFKRDFTFHFAVGLPF